MEEGRGSGVVSMILQAAGAGGALTTATTAFMVVMIVPVGMEVVGIHDARNFFFQWQEGIALRAGIPPPRGFTEKENDEGEDQTQADGECEGDDRHGLVDWMNPEHGAHVIGKSTQHLRAAWRGLRIYCSPVLFLGSQDMRRLGQRPRSRRGYDAVG